jgi:asparagine synthase (glutamine-hydrolysing)
MLGALAHRGPDGAGAVHTQCRATRHEVALGHRRLAIIDPVGAPQPMRATAAGLTLAFNGEAAGSFSPTSAPSRPSAGSS